MRPCQTDLPPDAHRPGGGRCGRPGRHPSRASPGRGSSVACWHRPGSGWHRPQSLRPRPGLPSCSAEPRSRTLAGTDRTIVTDVNPSIRPAFQAKSSGRRNHAQRARTTDFINKIGHKATLAAFRDGMDLSAALSYSPISGMNPWRVDSSAKCNASKPLAPLHIFRHFRKWQHVQRGLAN